MGIDAVERKKKTTKNGILHGEIETQDTKYRNPKAISTLSGYATMNLYERQTERNKVSKIIPWLTVTGMNTNLRFE